jgi:pimeloyl-ACP methyl ester carboxylesterase
MEKLDLKAPPALPGEMKTARVDGVRLVYREAGPPDGQPVVLVHGYPANHRSWRHQIPVLAQSHRVLAPDLIGWGDSERPRSLGFGYDTEVARLGRALDALGLEQVNLFGHDYGGFLSLGFAQRHPDRVQRLAILNSRAQGTFIPRWYATFGLVGLLGRTPGVRRLAARLPLEAINRRGMAALIRDGIVDAALLDNYVGWMGDRDGARWLLHFFADYSVRRRPELRDGLPRIGCPTAVIWGRRDAYLSTAIAEELARNIPRAELTMIDDAGHFVMEQRPAAVSDALLRLLER